MTTPKYVDANQLVADYQAGKGFAWLSKELRICQSRVKRILLEQGVKLRTHSEQSKYHTPVNRHKLPQIDTAQIAADYESGITLTSICKKHQIGAPYAKQVLAACGIALRTPSEAIRTHAIDDTFLDAIDSEVKAYYLGFMYADGYNGEDNKNKVSLSINKRDLHILKSFAAAFQTDRPIYSDAKDCVTLCFHNEHLSKRLAELGCHRAKTFTLTFPEWMPRELMPHFVRGYIDGDGWISFKESCSRNSRVCRVGAMGTTRFISRLCDVLLAECGVGTCIQLHPLSPGITSCIVQGREQVSTVLAWLYKDATIYLERKKRTAEQILVPYITTGKPNGEDCHLTTLTKEQVLVIKERILEGERFTIIAKAFRVDKTCIAEIASGRTWHHLTGWNDRNNASPGNLKGSSHSMAKLNDAQVRQIKELIRQGEANIVIATKFPVSRDMVSRIRTGKNWTHID